MFLPTTFKYKIRFLAIMLCLCFTLKGQDFTTFDRKSPIKASGSCMLSQNAYGVEGIAARQDPYSWAINANLNLKLFNVIDVPLSAYLSNDQNTFNKPDFNQFGASPKYKDLSLHIGYRNLQYSSYTLSGVTFLGGGIDYQPKNALLKYSAMYGRFSKANTEQNTDVFNSKTLSYERWGYAAKVSAGRNKHSTDLSIFHAVDDPNSLSPELAGMLMPEENLIVSLASRNAISKKININSEYAMSAFSRDIRMPLVEDANYLLPFFKNKISSSLSSAFNTAINYAANKYSVGISYKRIAPEYRSLGATYMSNDVEDILLNTTRTLFKSKINLSLSGGHQRNNLAKDLPTTNKRIIGSINCNYNVNKKLALGINYSNFSASNAPTSISVLDTFRYVQITDCKSLMGNYTFGKDKFKHTVTFNSSLQTVNTLNENATQSIQMGTNMIASTLGWNGGLSNIDLNINGGLSYNRYEQPEIMTSMSIGPTTGLTKGLIKKKMRVNLSWSLLENYFGNTINNRMHVIRNGISYTYNKHHSIKYSSNVIFRRSFVNINGSKKSNEYRGFLSYSYVF